MKKIFTLLTLFLTLYIRAQVGFGTATPNQSAEIEIQSTNKGMLVPRIGLTSATQKLQTNIDNANSLLVYNNGTVLPTGFYYWKAKIENDEDNGTWIAVGSEVSSMPKFFYMPSVVLPTVDTDTRLVALSNASEVPSNGFGKFGVAADLIYKIDLHKIFSLQFSAPIATSSSNANLSGFVLDADKYEYFVTFADTSVFLEIQVSEAGILTYKVNPDAIIRNGSFMNIVLKVKN